MKKFVDQTKSGKELSVKKIINLPKDDSSIGLEWFSSKEISPLNSLVVTDVSTLIPENANPTLLQTQGENSKVYFANELGVLEDENGNTIFNSEEINVTDLFLLEQNLNNRYYLNDLNEKPFAYSYYISSGYTLLEKIAFSNNSLDDFIEENKTPSSIKVIDENGDEYIDKNTGKKKYRILLQPLDVSYILKGTTKPYSIVVLLQDPNPNNLFLVYDKVTISAGDIISPVKLKNKESINSIPIFKRITEESVAVDPTSRHKKIFAKKPLVNKTNAVSSDNPSNDGFEIFVPKKALIDNRTYETFNWRLIGKINKSINTYSINYNEEISNISQRKINCAVLCTAADLANANASKSYSGLNPYVFQRLGNSSFNLSQYDFINPNADAQYSKNQALYWLVDIDNISSLSGFDILAWSPTSKISTIQGQKVKAFIESYHGTMVLDLSSSSLPADAAVSIYPYLTISSTTTSLSKWEYNTSNVFIDETKTNAWPINDSIFEKIGTVNVYGIYGSSIVPATGLAKNYRYFTDSSISSVNIVLKENTSTDKPIFISSEFKPTADALVRGNLLTTTTPILSYCNDVYLSSGNYDSATSNSSSTAIVETVVTPTAAIEGPMKILYNSVSVATISKMQTSKTLDVRSSKYYVMGNWNSSYVLNGEVLLEDEKSQYALIPDLNYPNTNKYCKNLTSSHGSIIDYFKKICYDSLPDQYSILFQDIDTANLELFVEVTNKDVLFANNTLVTPDTLTGDNGDIPTSYSLFRILNTQYTSHLFAYTNSNSVSFNIPGGFGPYVIKDKPINYNNDLIKDKFSTLRTSSSYRSYPFNFSIYNSYIQSTENSTSFNASWKASVTATGVATYDVKKTSPLLGSGQENKPGQKVYPSTGYSSVDVDDNEVIRNMNREDRISTPKNNFFYSGDIDINQYNGQYDVDARKTGEYVKYIQYTLAYSGIAAIKGIKVDGIYGTQTKSYVSIFQKEKDEIYSDGGVDSETKSYLIRVWKDLYKNNKSKFDAAYAKIKKQDPEVLKYIDEYTNPEIDELSTSDKDYRRISFSGSVFDGPKGVIRDTIYVRIPKEYNTEKRTDIDDVQLSSLTITPGKFKGASKYKGIKILKIHALKEENSSPTGQNAVKISGPIDYFKTSKVFNGFSPIDSEYKWLAITLEGTSLGGVFGDKAEGYSISEIYFGIDYTQKGSELPGGTTNQLASSTKPFTLTFDISGSTNDINVNSPKSIDLSGRKSTSYTISNQKITYTNSNDNSLTSIDVGEIDFNAKKSFVSNSVDGVNQLENTMTVDYLNLSFTVSTPIVQSVTTSTGTLAGTSAVSASISSNILTLATSALNYSNSTYKNTTPIQVSSYWLLKQDGSIVKNAKNSVTVLDGLILLCQASEDPALLGKPVGITPQSFNFTSSSSEEINIDYGSFVLTNSVIDNSGYMYGFYDNLRKEFLGSSLLYLEYINRGPNNIYIAVLATDADGNIGNSLDVIGQKTANTISPTLLPRKAAYPIYSIAYANATKIKVNAMQNNASKFDQWPLYVSSGSFVKDFVIDSSYGWSYSWLQNNKNKTIRATYSTLSLKNVPWSKFLGRPYVDVRDENPKVISSTKIQVMATPIATINEPSYNALGVMKSLVTVYTKDSINADWNRLPTSSIKSINCNTGVLDFESPIIPLDSRLVKVDYTIISNGVPLKQVNGNPIPLNPFLNKDIIESDKPLYVYVKPVKLEVKSSSGQAFSWNHISEYEYDTPINFTYDNSIFNQYDSVNFDPFALPIAVIQVINNFKSKEIELKDMRIRGGGVKSSDINSSGIYGDLGINKLITDMKEALSFWDVYPAMKHAYPKGGFVIIRLPKDVLNNFEDPEEIYSIIERNLTAGVAYKLQDTNGVDWGKS